MARNDYYVSTFIRNNIVITLLGCATSILRAGIRFETRQRPESGRANFLLPLTSTAGVEGTS